MFRKNYFAFLLMTVLFLASGISAFAQNTGPIRGRVELTKPDGKKSPVVGALVEVFRADGGKGPNTTTDKKGNFTFAGVPIGTRYVLSVSGANLSPALYQNVAPGTDNVVIGVSEGDGKRWTQDEVKQVMSAAQTTTGETVSIDTKKQEELKKQNEQIQAENAKIQKSTEIIKAALQEGAKAYDDKNYDLAIIKFEEGYNASPTFPGTAPLLLNNKTLALIKRATNTYNQSLKGDQATKDSAKASAKKDFNEGLIASDRSLEILKTATSTDANVMKAYENAKISAFRNKKEIYRLMAKTGIEREKGKEALVIFQEYMSVETDPAAKVATQYELALMLQDSNEFEMSVVEFEKILAADPNNIDALAGIGLSLVNVGYVNLEADAAKSKEQLQKAANYLQKFVDLAPATHTFKEEAKGIIATLKEEQKVTPQKTTKKKN